MSSKPNTSFQTGVFYIPVELRPVVQKLLLTHKQQKAIAQLEAIQQQSALSN